ncbi:MAG TPA: hypothetical protein VGI73_15065 [Solirubrobacterales bacterium]|jgi:hypothetical protein
MRDALNNNPVAQVGAVLVLVAVAAFMLLKPGGGGESTPEATISVGGTEMSQSEAASAAGQVVEAGVEAAIESGALASAGAGAATMPTSVPAPPPPHAFSAAYDSGKTVVLLVVHSGGIDDRLTALAATALTAMPEVALIPVTIKQLPRYAAVTVGLDLNRVPALVVMTPKRLSGGVPQATVDYGFQTPETLVQAVRDASYKGPEATYHPE